MLLDFKSVLKTMGLVARFAEPIQRLILAGAPVEEAVMKQSPELHAAFQDLARAAAAAEPVAPSPAAVSPQPTTQKHVALQKAVFAPEQVSPQERAWMDRASQSIG